MKHVLFCVDDIYTGNELFNRRSPLNRDDRLELSCRLQEELACDGYQLDTLDQGDIHTADVIVFVELYLLKPIFGRYLWSCYGKPVANHRLTELFRALPRTAKRVLLLQEPPSVCPHNFQRPFHRYFDTILTWNDDFIDNRKYFKFNFAQPDWHIETPVPFADRAFCALIASDKTSTHPHELYSARVQVIEFFQRAHPDLFDLYGSGWERYPVFRGRAADKLQTLSRYKFNICYENNHHLRGYVSEKIFDSLRAFCVPVYWGADNIAEYVHPEAFIDRRNFKSTDALFDYLSQMNAAEYQQYLAAIARYLSSPTYQQFSMECALEVLKHAIKDPWVSQR